MPEGDSVWKLARRLDRQLTGRTVVRSDFRVPRLADPRRRRSGVLGHDTHGKHLLTRLAGLDGSPPVTLHSHLRMDGSWTTTGPGKRLPGRVVPDVRLVLALDDGRTAHGIKLHDLELVPTADEHRLVGHLGPDPLRADWDAEEAVRRLSSDPTVPLVSALLDQRLMAGLGNLWANELAFLTGVSPGRRSATSTCRAWSSGRRRCCTTRRPCPQAYQVTTGSMWPGTDHWVTGRQRRGCLRCGTAVRVAAEVPGDAGNRRTWWCPRCQPGPGPEARRAACGPAALPRAEAWPARPAASGADVRREVLAGERRARRRRGRRACPRRRRGRRRGRRPGPGR